MLEIPPDKWYLYEGRVVRATRGAIVVFGFLLGPFERCAERNGLHAHVRCDRDLSICSEHGYRLYAMCADHRVLLLDYASET